MFSLYVERRAQKLKADLCWQYGCLVVINETRRYDVVAFYADTAESPDAGPAWGDNLLDRALGPRKAMIAAKTGRAAMCERLVRFTLQDRKTKASLDANGTINLCSTPKMDTVLHINIEG